MIWGIFGWVFLWPLGTSSRLQGRRDETRHHIVYKSLQNKIAMFSFLVVLVGCVSRRQYAETMSEKSESSRKLLSDMSMMISTMIVI